MNIEAAIRELQRLELNLAVRDARLFRSEVNAGGHKFHCQGLDGAAGHQSAEIRFVQSELGVVKIEHREAGLHLGPAEILDRQAQRAIHLQSLPEIVVGKSGEEKDSVRNEDRQPGPVAQCLPFTEAVGGHLRINRVLAVGGADHARLAAR